MAAWRVAAKLLLLPLFVPCLALTCAVVPLSLVLRPVAPRWSVRLAALVSLAWWSLLGVFFRLTVRMRRPAVPAGDYLVVANHVSAADFLVVNALNRHRFAHAKYVIKRSLRWAPVFYQAVLLLRFLVLRRDFAADRPRIERYLRAVAALRLPMWLVLFCEGHRFTPRWAAESRAFCAARGIEPFTHVLCPRQKGFALVAAGLRGTHIRAVLDVTIYARGRVPSLAEVLLGGRVVEYECDARVVPLEDIADPAAFLIAAWRRKDALIARWAAAPRE